MIPKSKDSVLLQPGYSDRYGHPGMRMDCHRHVGRGQIDDTSDESNVAALSVSSAINSSVGTEFDGVDDYATVTAGDEASVNAEGAGTAFTFLAKVSNVTAAGAGAVARYLFVESDSGEAANSLSSLYINESGQPVMSMVLASGASHGTKANATVINDGGTHTIAGVFAPSATAGASRVKIAVDGGTMEIGVAGDSWVSTADATTIGQSLRSTGFPENRYFKGVIHEIARFPSALSQAAITAYHAGTFPEATCTGRWVFTAPQTMTPDMTVGLWAFRKGGTGLWQGTVANQPVYTADQINGFPALVFDGTNDCLKRTAASLVAETGCVLIAAKTTVTDAEQILYSQADEATADQFLKLGISATNKLWYEFDNGAAVTQVELAGNADLGTDWHLLEWVSDGSAITMFVDGSEQNITEVGGTNAGQWFADVTGTDNSMIGARQTSAGVGDYLTGVVAEVIAFDGAPSTGQRNRLRAKLANKYGIVLAIGILAMTAAGEGLLLAGGEGLLL